MRKIYEPLHFLFSLTLLTPREEKRYKRKIIKMLCGVKTGVKLGHFGFVPTQNEVAGSNSCIFHLMLYLLDMQYIVRVDKHVASDS